MSTVVGSLWWMLVALGVLVTFHEFGHFWVARRCGVQVLKFSVGFGRPLWSRRGKDGTEYVVAAIPLLAEGGARATYPWLGRVLVVDVPADVQIARLQQRDGSSPELARRMVAASCVGHGTVWSRVAVLKSS